ncbi:MAG: ABC transporter permease [Fibrobacteria bacterium]|nr:ABC transporter permease [Fibrobacteria bacterium]
MNASETQVQTRIRPEDLGIVDVTRELAGAWHLVAALARRQISVRYAQTAFGAMWVLIQPLFTTLLYTLVFGLFVKVPTGGVPYPLFALTGMIAWGLFSQSMERASGSLIQDERLITKVYFPRLALPLSAALSALVDFIVAGAILVPVSLIYGYVPGWSIFPALACLLPLFLAALATGTLLASLNIRWRDLRQVAPFFTQILVWASPVAWPLEVAPPEWQPYLLLNPLTPPILYFRSAITGSAPPPMLSLAASLVSTLALSFLAFLVFRRVERDFADYI